MNEIKLPEFQKYLASNKLVSKKHIPFYAHWVTKFISFSNSNEDLNINLRIQSFVEQLNNNTTIEDWQVQQAETAVKLYIDEFLKGDTSKFYPNTRDISFDQSSVLKKMHQAIRIKHYSYKTERSYINWTKRFFEYLINIKKEDIKKIKLDSGDVRDFLSYLAVTKRVSASTQNQAFNALLFLFRDILDIDLQDMKKTVRAKRGPRLPVVLSVDETQQLFKHITGKNLLMAQLIYGSGLRLMELARLRVKDIDFDSNLIFVRSSKGDKDRTTILPQSIIKHLKLHLEEVKRIHEKDLESGYGEVYLPDALGRKYPNAAKEWCWQYVFPSAKLSVDPLSGKIRRHHISAKSIQNGIKTALEKSGIAKHVTVHTLRHSFATHLLLDGVNIREIQELMGHKNIETTMIYTHVVRNMSNIPRSPLDNLYVNNNPL